jgi:hypothetical protein
MLKNLSYTPTISVLTISNYAIKWNNNLLETRAKSFLAGKEAQWDKRGGRVLLADNTGGVTVMLLTIRFRFQLDPLLHKTHIFLAEHVYTQNRLR